MKLRFTCIFFFILLFTAVQAQRRNGMVIVKNESGIVTAKGPVKKKQREGRWSFYSETGSLIRETDYHLGKINGADIYYFNGDTIAYTEYVNGIPCGVSKRWSSSFFQLTSLEHLGKTGQRTGENYYWYDNGKLSQYYFADTSGNATQYTYEYTGELKMILHYKNGVQDGLQTTYVRVHTGNDSIASVVNYSNGRKKGPSINYENGKIISKENYCDNLLCDTAYYYRNGSLSMQIIYLNGMKNGPEKIYEEGHLVSETFYTGNVQNGKQTYYSPNGNIAEENWYKMNVLDSGKKYYNDPEHNLSSKTVKGNTPAGISAYQTTEYYSNGNRKADYTYTSLGNAQKFLEGPYTEYYPDGKKKSEKNYVLNKIQGRYKSWNEKGVLLLDVQCSDNILHGPVSVFTNSGTPIDSSSAEFDRTVVKYMSAEMFYHGQNMPKEVAGYYKADSASSFENCIVYTSFPPPAETKEVNGEVYVYATEMPEFPGGQTEFMKYIQKNMRYPAMEKEMGIQGTVYISFIIDRHGYVQNVYCVKEVAGGQGLNKEAMRVIKMMPAWRPAKINGHAVNFQMVQPIRFVIQ
jgi:TonB family protein